MTMISIRQLRACAAATGLCCIVMTGTSAIAQEKMTAQIANTIEKVLQPQGVGVVLKAEHQCMTARGVMKPGTDLVTSRMLGCFRDSAITRQEFLTMVA